MIQKSYPFNRPITFPYVVSPGNPRETLSPQENEMFALKRGGKAKNKKSKKQQGITQIQKVNIKIGDLSKLLERKKNDDTATIMKSKTPSLVFPSNDSTYIRLEAPAYRYAQPLPSVIPNLYQANPSSISNPILSSIPSSSRGGNLQPAVNNPILQDTDPNDLQRNSSREHSIRAIPSYGSVSGSVSGIVGSDEYKYYQPLSSASLSSTSSSSASPLYFSNLGAPIEIPESATDYRKRGRGRPFENVELNRTFLGDAPMSSRFILDPMSSEN
jgi:hypothetical protein